MIQNTKDIQHMISHILTQSPVNGFTLQLGVNLGTEYFQSKVLTSDKTANSDPQ